VGEADTLRKARRLVRDCDFDVMLADLNLSDGSGFDLIAYSKAVRSMAEIVVVSILNQDQDALRAFELGAAGFLVKNSCLGNFSQAVLDVANGGAAITPTLARRLLLRGDREHVQVVAPDREPKIMVRLSEREKEILRLIASGLTSPEIGRRLAIAAMTVNAHVRNIYRKLHVRSRAQAVSRATTWGFL
jgi:DNA-binding NarL/FixJ family response regulator